MNNDFVFGMHAVQNLFDCKPERVLELCIQKGRTDKRISQLVDMARSHRVVVRFIDRRQLDSKVDGVHQGVVAKVAAAQVFREEDLEDILNELDDPPFLVVLDSVTDPHNLGACLRTADAVGVNAVIIPKNKSACLNGTVSKVACGAAETVPVIQVTNLARTLLWLKNRGVWLIGAADDSSQSIFQADLKGSIAVVMGAEGVGMRRLTREHCDFLVNIPMAGKVSSLNVSVATGVFLYEAVRQRSSF